MNRFSNKFLKSYFDHWENVKEEIAQLYEEQDASAPLQMEKALQQYIRLLDYGGMEMNEQTGNEVFTLLPLNGEERIDFIKKQLHSRYAFIQLSALFDETKKKAARLAVTTK